MRVELIRDVLDKQLLDAHRTRMGKVDGLVMELRRGAPPRVVALRVGSRVWSRRVGTWAAALAAHAARWFGGDERGVWEIPWTAVLHLGKSVQIEEEAQRAPSLAWERTLCERLIGRIPGSDR